MNRVNQKFCYVIRDDQKALYSVYADIDLAKREKYRLQISNDKSIFEIVQVKFNDESREGI